MTFVHFTIAFKGRHLFRTDEYQSFDVDFMQEVLIRKFPKEEGYRVTRHDRPNSSTMTELN